LTAIQGTDLPAGWSGKLWAMKQGIDCASENEPDYFLFTDADIVYAPDTLARLVSQAQANGLVLNSLMVALRCESFAEHAFVPAFIFFFQMLYPFAWVNKPERATAAAAGGCMLVRRDALNAAGGIEAIRGALIDDCALARKLKPQGPIRLSLTQRVHSIRGYATLQDIRRMVARSAYAQLRYSPLLLAGTVAGMALVYLAPVLLTVFGHGLAQALGLLAWALMTVAFLPILGFYRLTPLWAPFLPPIALAYMAFTADSAYQYARKRGGLWKGRVQSNVNGVR
jgi:hopene-associated glycosyltransferase HpnB